VLDGPNVSLNVAQRLIEALGGELDIQPNSVDGTISRVILLNGICSSEEA
jgi:hypothetical protein